MKNNLFKLSIIILIFILPQSCKKGVETLTKEYEQNEKFFSRYSSNNSNGNIQSNSLIDFVQSDIIDTVMNILKEKDLKYQIVDKIVNKYGYAKWNESLIVNNLNRLKTVIVPISDSLGKTRGLILVYQITKEKAAFKVINRATKQNKLKEVGDINAHLFTQKTLDGIFESFDKLKTANSNPTSTIVKKSEGVTVRFKCWYYTSTAPNGDFTISNTQCSYSLIFTPDVYNYVSEDESLSPEDLSNIGVGSSDNSQIIDENVLGEQSALFKEPNSNDILVDLNKIMKCFQNIQDAGATFSVKLCVDLPKNDNPAVLWTFENNAGHVFLTFTKSNGTESVSQTVGFYPSTILSISTLPVSSRIVDDGTSNHEYNASISMNNLSSTEFQNMINQSLLQSSKKYDLNDNNCANFALNIFNSTRTSPINSVLLTQPIYSPATGFSDIKFNQSPAGLYQQLMVIKSSGGSDASNIETNVLKNAPNSKGECN